jgi:tripartite ATP-independent transporter DctM subunit
VGACSLFAATSGSSVATTIAVGKICIPEMRRYGYPDAFATGAASSGGLLGIMIPPSIPMVIYGIATETSIGQLLIAGVFPGIMTAVVFFVGIVAISLFRPEWSSAGESFPWREKFLYIGKSWGVFVLFGIIIGGIYSGVFSPSEAGAAAAFVAFLMALTSRGEGPRLQRIMTGFADAVPAFVGVYLILIGGMIFSSFITRTGIPSSVAEYLVNLGLGPYPTLILILLTYIPLGMFLDPVSMFLITIPFFFPAIQSMGFHPVWFGVIVVKMIEIANLTPPIGMNIFACKSIVPEDISLESIFHGSLIFLGMEVLVTLPILITIPQISLFLPSKM